MTPLLMIGASSLAQACLAIVLETSRWHVIGVLDDDAEKISVSPDVQNLGPIAKYKGLKDGTPDLQVIIAVGDPLVRDQIYRKLCSDTSVDLATVVSAGSHIMAGSAIDAGCIVFPGAAIGAHARIGKLCVINSNASIGANTSVAKCCSIAPGASIGSEVTIGERCYFGLNSAVMQGVNVGDDCVVGALSFVSRSLSKGRRALGIPATTSDRQ